MFDQNVGLNTGWIDFPFIEDFFSVSIKLDLESIFDLKVKEDCSNFADWIEQVTLDALQFITLYVWLTGVHLHFH